MTIRTSPSILAADFANLEREIRRAEAAGADYIHIDVMDGIFVPNISIGVPVVASVRKVTELPLDVHLMITRPGRYVDAFCDAGADILTLHVEADTEGEIRDALRRTRAHGVRPSLSVKPGTPAEALLPFLPLCGMVLVMTVEPGFGGQKFMADMLPKVTALRQEIDAHFPGCELEVDGGVNAQTAQLCTQAGADVLVAGSAFFGAADPAALIREIKGA